MIHFEWDEAKAARNLRVHGIDFDDAMLVFDDPFRLTEEDSVVNGEERFRTIGLSLDLTLLLIVHLEEIFEENLYVRIISARRATPGESKDYDENHT